jgi:hypothetical protein
MMKIVPKSDDIGADRNRIRHDRRSALQWLLVPVIPAIGGES